MLLIAKFTFYIPKLKLQDSLLEIGENENLQRGVHNEVTLRYRLLVTIWVLANRETCRQVADRFDTTRGKLSFIFCFHTIFT